MGELEPRTATALGLASVLSGLALSAVVSLVAAYLALNLEPHVICRHSLIPDVMAIAGDSCCAWSPVV